MKKPILALIAAGVILLAAAMVLLLADGDEPDPAAPEHGVPGAESDSAGDDGGRAPDELGDVTFTGERILVPLPSSGKELTVVVLGVARDPDGAAMPTVTVAFEKAKSVAFEKAKSIAFQEAGSGEIGAVRYQLCNAVETDAGGSYATRLAPGEYRISAHLATQRRGHDMWYPPEIIVVPREGELVHDVRFIRPRATICGTIKTLLGEPLDLGVALCTVGGKHLRRTGSDETGYYSIDGVAPGTYRFCVERGSRVGEILFPWRESTARERSADRWPEVEVTVDDTIVRHDLVLAEPVRASFRITLPGQEEYLDGGTLFLREEGNGRSAPRLGQERAYAFPIGDAGRTASKALFPGEYTAYFWGVPDGLSRPDPVRLAVPPENSEQILDVSFAASQGRCRIEGRVVDQSGKPVARARIQLWDRPSLTALPRTCARAEAVCDEEGVFSITGLRAGSYVTRRDRRPISNTGPLLFDTLRDETVVLGGGGDAAAAAVTIRVFAVPVTSLAGRVDAAGVSIPLRVLATVQPGADYESKQFWALVDQAGAFNFPHIPRVEEPVVLEVVAQVGPSGETALARTAALIPKDGDRIVVIER